MTKGKVAKKSQGNSTKSRRKSIYKSEWIFIKEIFKCTKSMSFYMSTKGSKKLNHKKFIIIQVLFTKKNKKIEKKSSKMVMVEAMGSRRYSTLSVPQSK